MRKYIFVTIFGLLPSISAFGAPEFHQPTSAEWQGYWHQGKAEVTSYSLIQSRYGKHHPGQAVLVFVTEPFSRSKQVKLDDPGKAGNDALTVLKLNHTRKFNTGIYPYSTMRSIFSPTHHTSPVKVTFSAQEWCGQVYMQLNRNNDGYEGQVHSYFESEGDKAFSVPKDTIVEDALWTQVRINPTHLPLGKVRLLPSLTFLRFHHLDTVAQEADIRWSKAAAGRWFYEIRYTTIDRKLRLEIDESFPFTIYSWTEGPLSAQTSKPDLRVTRGVRLRELFINYWDKNQPSDSPLREHLGLPQY
ncbi:MAG: hypothetical protein KTR25_20250 [Myxococcales bacterium]|nr:hypothetical protein [Myxococcales bacterium]